MSARQIPPLVLQRDGVANIRSAKSSTGSANSFVFSLALTPVRFTASERIPTLFTRYALAEAFT